MFILFQVPIADSRSLIDSDNYRLGSPSWTLPYTRPENDPNEDFIRSFGGTKKRVQGSPNEWAGEIYYCLAERGMRFDPSFPKKIFGPKHKKIRLDCAFRRFYCGDEDRIVSRLELGFTRAEGWNSSLNEPVFIPSPTKLDADDIRKIIEDFLALDVYIHAFDNNHQKKPKAEKCLLQHSGVILSQEYLHLTTSHQGLKSRIPLEKWWVTSGTPMLLIELQKDSLGGNSYLGNDTKRFKYEITASSLEALGAKKIDLKNSEDIQAFYFHIIPTNINVWIILYDEDVMKYDNRKRRLREIRLHLSRLNAERYCLQAILRQIVRGEIAISRTSTQTQVIQKYISESIKRLSKKEYYGVSQVGILEELQKNDALIYPSENANLLHLLRKAEVRLDVENKVAVLA